MTLPPRHLVEDAVLHTVLPPAGAAIGVFVFGLIVFGRKAAPVTAAVAFVAALAAALFAKPIVPWVPELTKRVEWIPALAAAGAVAGALGRLPRGAGWQVAAWAAVLALGVAKVCPAKFLKEPWWAVPAGAALVSAAGLVPAALSRRNPGAGVPFAVALCLFAAGGVALHAHAALLMDVAVVAGSALLGLALVCLFVRVDVTGGLAGASVVLGGVLLSAYYEADDECKVPGSSYLIPSLAPLALAVAYLPAVHRLSGWKLRLAQLLPIVVLLAYAIWAATAEKLDFESF
jgi:hypothetical protein